MKEKGSRRWLVESLVRPLGVGEHEPLGQLPVEESEVGEEEILVIVDEGLLEGAVETLGMSVHLGRLRVGGPASDPPLAQGLGKARLKLAAVVGKHDAGRLGEETQRPIQRPTGMTGMLGGDRPGEGQAARRIDEAHDVAAETVANALDGIPRPAFEGRGPGLRVFGRRRRGRGRPRASRRAVAKRILSGARARIRPTWRPRAAQGRAPRTKCPARQEASPCPDLGPEAWVGPGTAPSARGGTLGHEGGRIVALGLKFRFPAVEGSARDLEGLARGRKALGVPEP